MANRDLLKEAIADAKAVKETAIANAKAALEESFGPYLREKLAAKLAEMDGEEEDLYEAEEEVEETYNMDEMDNMDEAEEMYEAEDMDEMKNMDEVNLDELLRELDELDEETSEPHGNIGAQTPEGEPLGFLDEEDEMEESLYEAEGEEEEETMSLEDMSEEDLKSFIEDVISDMVAAGELEAGHEGEEGEEEEEGEEMESEEEVNLDELMFEVKKEKEVEEAKKEVKKLKKDLNEAYAALETIKTELNEVRLFNAKLLYTNKIFKAKNLTESQKVKVLESFDKAASVKEAKLVYETLSEGFKEKKSPIKESLLRGSASKPAGVSEKKPILEINDQFARWQTLAGIKK